MMQLQSYFLLILLYLLLIFLDRAYLVEIMSALVGMSGFFSMEQPANFMHRALGMINGCRHEISGTIPTELGNLKNLVELTLLRNNLTGLIPHASSNLRNLALLPYIVVGSIPPAGKLATVICL
ncbi:probable leucine-rich repeat receptor-like protein kinase At1g35710 [Magnolia sinica]|uniref:probable leucine-rich repeat receptor-like protein kinase At1g35710 n=1 Tax=Magnolia sinica TaxID=86752 RepID=UPI00265AD900|nr:probable leucine-rich repeat receptor-like protein kinase At1g35710 [Magnolia sinica]